MNSPARLALVLLLSTAPAAVACQRQEPPRLAPSTNTLGYAMRYGHELDLRQQQLNDGIEATSVTIGLMRTFPDELKEPDWSKLTQLYRGAAAEGQGAAYGQSFEETRAVQRFFDEEKRAVSGRTAYAATHAAKEAGCEVNLQGAVSYGLTKAVEDQLKKRAEGDSDTHQTLQREAAELGKANVAPLELQLERIRAASHTVHYRLEVTRLELRQLSDSFGDAKGTLEDKRAELNKDEDPKTQTARRDQAKAIDAALAELEELEAKVESALDKAEQRKESLRTDFDAALNALIEEVERRAEAQPKR